VLLIENVDDFSKLTFAEELGPVYFIKHIKKKLHVQQKYLFTYELFLATCIFLFTNDSDTTLIFHRFIEYGEYKNNYYGTSIDSVRSVLAKNKVCLLDVQPHVSKTVSYSGPYDPCNLSYFV
jgi:hypothetical protein